jgi:VanZ family protein
LKIPGKTYRIVFWLGITGLFVLSSVPDLQPNQAINNEDTTIRLDYMLHFIAYFIIGMFYMKSYPLSFKGVLLIIGYAVIEEVHQYWIPGRTLNPVDLLFDLAGLAAAILIFRLTRIKQ